MKTLCYTDTLRKDIKRKRLYDQIEHQIREEEVKQPVNDNIRIQRKKEIVSKTLIISGFSSMLKTIPQNSQLRKEIIKSPMNPFLKRCHKVSSHKN